MKILLGSKNPTKRKSLELALDDLKIKDYIITSIDAPSEVDSFPIGYEIIRGANNRNKFLKDYSLKEKIDYDYLCSIEGGYIIDESGFPFVVTYCLVEDRTGSKYIGKSLGLSLSWKMFEYISKGYNLNAAIEKVTGQDYFKRGPMDKDSVISAFLPFFFKEQRDKLDNYIKSNMGENNI